MNVIEMMFSFLRSELCGTKVESEVIEAINDDTLLGLYSIATTHDVAHIIGAALSKVGRLANGGEIEEKYNKKSIVAVYRYEQLNYELKQLCDFFEEHEIPFMPLKGSVLREYYRETWMRTSCDIDILVHECDLDRAKDLLIQKLEYRFKSKDRHDISLFSPSGVNLELHYSLIEEDIMDKADEPLKEVWKAAMPSVQMRYKFELGNEMFYYYHMAHMAKHFLIGGCGIRPFMDIYVLNHNLQYDKTKRNRLLEMGGLLSFAEKAELLSEIWFGEAEHTELTLNMQQYLLDGGVYGSLENRVAMQQTQQGGKLRYAFSRIWLSYDVLKFQYPILEKRKWLFPICQIRRWSRLAFGEKLKRSRQELSINSSVTQDKAQAVQALLEELGL